MRLLLVAFVPILAAVAPSQTKLLRFPDIHDDRIALVYAGDLWTAPDPRWSCSAPDCAIPGLELFPKFSPDGKWIAFTGQYDGDEQVYVVPGGRGASPDS